MHRRLIVGVWVAAVFSALLVSSYIVRPARAWTGDTIYINPDGSIYPPGAPILNEGNLYTLTDNIFVDTGNDGIVISKSGITLDGLGFYEIGGVGSAYGIFSAEHSGLTIKNLVISNFYSGIEFYTVYSSRLEGNMIHDCTDGIAIMEGINNTIVENHLTSNYGLGVLLGFGSYNNVFENEMSGSPQFGIVLNATSHDYVIGNLVHDNLVGIRLDYSSYNTLEGNFLTSNDEAIFLIGSSFCNIGRNNIVANIGEGIVLYLNSTGNVIFENTVSANGVHGMGINAASNNDIYHNNFIDNTKQVYTFASENTWDDGYPSGGNYWSNYTGVDYFRGPTQDISGSDGIGDTPHVIDAANRDNYPLMGQFGGPTSTGLSVTVHPIPGICLIFENVTAAGSTFVNLTATGLPPLPGFVHIGPYYDIKVSAMFSGNVMIRITYDDSGLTLAQEMSLRMNQWNASGDIDYSGKVDLKDVYTVGKAFASYLVDGAYWHEPPRSCCPHSAKTDLNGDGKVDLKDYYRTSKQFGKDAAWADITLYVDTENNVIVGVTDHFSGIGIHLYL